MQDPENIFFEIKNHTGYITLNRPSALNALNLPMIKKLGSQLKNWENNPEVKQVIITSRSLRAFCAGGDLKELYFFYEQHKNQPKKVRALLEKFFEEEYSLNAQIKHYSKPYIAIINGISMGGGLGLSLHASVKIAFNNLVLAMPETTIGYFTDAGASYFLSRLEGELGTYMALTSARLNAAEALSVGLIDQVIGELPTENPLLQHRELINACFQYDAVEDILEALLKNNSPFAMETYYQLLTKSPTSLKLNLALLRQARGKSFDECIQKEYELALYFIDHPDFREGIRAVVIDKDKTPQWSPEKLADVKLSEIKF